MKQEIISGTYDMIHHIDDVMTEDIRDYRGLK